MYKWAAGNRMQKFITVVAPLIDNQSRSKHSVTNCPLLPINRDFLLRVRSHCVMFQRSNFQLIMLNIHFLVLTKLIMIIHKTNDT
jgi:hypothetical protein